MDRVLLGSEKAISGPSTADAAESQTALGWLAWSFVVASLLLTTILWY